MPSTSYAACTLLFVRTAYSNAMTTHNWPDDLSTQGSDRDWSGRPSKRGFRNLDLKNRRDSSGGASSSRRTSSSGQSRAKQARGPTITPPPRATKTTKPTPTSKDRQLSGKWYILLSTFLPAVVSTNCRAVNLAPTTVRYRCLQPPHMHARRRS